MSRARRRWAAAPLALLLASCAAAGPSDVAPRPISCPPSAKAVRVSAGVSAGLSIPGPQDLKFKRYDSSWGFRDFLDSTDADGTTESFENVFVTAWVERGFLRGFGLQVEAAHWTTTVKPDGFVDRMPPPHVLTPPPFGSVPEERFALLVDVLHKVPLPGVPDEPGAPYGYVGICAGPVHTSVRHGRTGWATGGGVLAGAAFPLSDGVRARVEGRFFLARDSDAKPSQDWRVDTSGTSQFALWPHIASSPGWPHQDTRFYDLLLGLEFDL